MGWSACPCLQVIRLEPGAHATYRKPSLRTDQPIPVLGAEVRSRPLAPRLDGVVIAMASKQADKTIDATSHDIEKAAREAKRSWADARVLGFVLFWEQKKGGKPRKGGHWRYHSACEIAAETSQSVRTVERALSRLYASEVLIHHVGYKPGGSGQTTSFMRPGDGGHIILARAREIAASRLKKSKKAADLADPEPADCLIPNGQFGGSHIQTDVQKDVQKDITISAVANAPADWNYQEEKIELQEEKKGEEEEVPKPTSALTS